MEETEVGAMEREMKMEKERETEMLKEKAMEILARKREALMAMERKLEEKERALEEKEELACASEREEIARMRAAIAAKREKLDAVPDRMPCRRHLRHGPVLMEDPFKAASVHGIRSFLKDDPALCYICVARAAVLRRIEAAGGDSVKAAAESELRSRGDICVRKRIALPPSAKTTAEEEGKAARPVGVVKQTMKVRNSYIMRLLTDAPATPLRTLPEDYFDMYPYKRELMLTLALTTLSRIDEMDNILGQFLEKGYAMTEYQIDYGY